MSERKRVFITMDAKTHLNLKSTASKTGAHMGDFIQMLIDGLEARIKRAYQISGIVDHTTLTDQNIIFALLDADKNGWPEAKLDRVLCELGDKDDEWTDRSKY